MAEEAETTGSTNGFGNLVAYLATVLVLLAIGGGVLWYMIWTKPVQRGQPPQNPGRLVSVCRVQTTSHRLAVTAYGTTRASEVWKAIAEVRGRAVKVDPRFEPGELLPAGLLLASIDPTDYRLAVKRFEAEALAKQLALGELDQTEKNLKLIIEPRRRQLALARAEYERQQQAFDRKAVSQSVFEAASSAYEASLTALLQTQNSLALLNVRRQLTEASWEAAKAQWEQARRDLEKCEIVLPFAARCASKSVELNQFVAAGEQLGTFLALEMAEVVAMVETRKMPLMLPESLRDMKDLDLTQLTLDESFWRQIRIPVEVSWALGDRRPVWWGRVARIGSSLDPGTQTVPVIIEVPDPYKNVQPGVRPPLIPDVFCEITAYGATVHDVVVIPRDALRDGRVYLLRPPPSQEAAGSPEPRSAVKPGDEQRGTPIRGELHIVPVDVVALEENVAVIKEGLRTGDLLVLADLSPASQRMPLRGELVDNPARPRTRINVPQSVFEEPNLEEPNLEEPNLDESTDAAADEPGWEAVP